MRTSNKMPTPKVNVYIDIAHGARSLVRASATAVTPYTAKGIVVRAFKDVAESLAQTGDPVDGSVPFHITVSVTKYRRI